MQRLRYLVGVLTLVAAGIGTAFLVGGFGGRDADSGTPLRVEFRDARGLRSGADVRYRGVTVGTVARVHTSDDGNKALVELRLDAGGSGLASVDSSFWIVTPRFGGLTGGATGLDTLVRDAYVAFLTPQGHGSPLRAGSLVVGSERPPAAGETESLEPVQHGDLLMSLLLPENHGLRAGSPVVFRGIPTGDVRSIELAPDGTHVAVRLRIAQKHRQTVTDKAVFWVARPHLSGALFTGFTVSDLGSALQPYVAYYGETGKGVPVEDNYRAAAVAERPDLQVAGVPPAALQKAAVAAPAGGEPLRLVRIVYAAVQEHSMSSDTPIQREGSGVLWLDRSGRAVVITARSLCDASFTETSWFGRAPKIQKEQIKVLLAGGPVLRAGRVWVEPGGQDLAALVLDDVPPDLVGTPPALLGFALAADSKPTNLRPVREDGTALPAVAFTAELPLLPSWGAVALAGEQVLGVHGRKAAHEPAPAVVPIALVPEDLRPGQ